MTTQNKKGFTFVELIVSTVIIVILASVWFYSYIWYLSEARDSERKSNLAKVASSLKLYKQKRWSYPLPWDYYSITNSWHTVAYQWELNNNVSLSTLDKLPVDWFTDEYYSYSITKKKLEYQLALTYENWDYPLAWLEWDYKTISKNVLPTIILAKDSTASVEIHSWVLDWSTNRDYFVFNKWKNLPYSLMEPFHPYYDWTSVDSIIGSSEIDLWQNSDYRSCSEIQEAWKIISWTWNEEEYQILNSSWALTNTWCTF